MHLHKKKLLHQAKENPTSKRQEVKHAKSSLFASGALIVLAGLVGALTSNKDNAAKQALDSVYRLTFPEQYSSSVAARLAHDEQKSALAYYDQAKMVFQCFEHDACAEIIKDRTSDQSLQANKKLYRHIQPYTHAFLLSKSNDMDRARIILQSIPDSANRIVDLMNIAYYLRSQILYDNVVESGQNDYVNTFRETIENGAGDCDDAAITEAMLAHMQGYETYLISYRAAGFGHLVNAVEIKPGTELEETLALLEQFAPITDLKNLPVLQLNTNTGWKDFLLLDGSGRHMLSDARRGEKYTKADSPLSVITRSALWAQIAKNKEEGEVVKVGVTHLPITAQDIDAYSTSEQSITTNTLDQHIRIATLQSLIDRDKN